ETVDGVGWHPGALGGRLVAEVGVLNARRHHRGRHALSCSRETVWICAQRPKASQRAALPPRGEPQAPHREGEETPEGDLKRLAVGVSTHSPPVRARRPPSM